MDPYNDLDSRTMQTLRISDFIDSYGRTVVQHQNGIREALMHFQ